MSRYAGRSDVSPDRSRAEIEKVLRRYNASGFMYGYEDDPPRVVVAFKMGNRTAQFTLKTPPRSDFATSPAGRSRSKDAIERVWLQASRQRWRALVLVVKAKLEAVEAGISTFDEEFLAHLLLADGSTIADQLIPQIEAMTEGRAPIRLLPPGGAP